MKSVQLKAIFPLNKITKVKMSPNKIYHDVRRAYKITYRKYNSFLLTWMEGYYQLALTYKDDTPNDNLIRLYFDKTQLKKLHSVLSGISSGEGNSDGAYVKCLCEIDFRIAEKLNDEDFRLLIDLTKSSSEIPGLNVNVYPPEPTYYEYMNPNLYKEPTDDYVLIHFKRLEPRKSIGYFYNITYGYNGDKTDAKILVVFIPDLVLDRAIMDDVLPTEEPKPRKVLSNTKLYQEAEYCAIM
jgi:hypothetical protein